MTPPETAEHTAMRIGNAGPSFSHRVKRDSPEPMLRTEERRDKRVSNSPRNEEPTSQSTWLVKASENFNIFLQLQMRMGMKN